MGNDTQSPVATALSSNSSNLGQIIEYIPGKPPSSHAQYDHLRRIKQFKHSFWSPMSTTEPGVSGSHQITTHAASFSVPARSPS
jgi:hypothetical protein